MERQAPPTRRKDGRRERTARAITEAANRLFHEQGLPRTTIDEIAEAAGVSVGSVYVHYGSKEALYLTLVEQAVETHAAYLADAVHSESPLERLFNAGDAYVRFGLDNPVMFGLLSMRAHQPTKRVDLASRERRITERMEEIVIGVGDDLLTAIEQGEIMPIDARRAMLFLWGAWSGVIALSLREDRLQVSRKELVDTLAIARDVLARGLGAERPRDLDGPRARRGPGSR